MEDITGLQFNDLTAVCSIEHSKGHGQMWLWRCICGKETELPIRRVRSGHDKSCGCLKHRHQQSFKMCKHCGEPSYRKNRHGNFASVCQKCYNKQCNSFKSRHPKDFMVQCARVRAKKAGIQCTIAADDFEIPEFCPVLGIKLESGNKKHHDASPSLDRIEPNKGYIPGNVVVMSFKANRMKGESSPDDLRRIADWIEAQLSSQPELAAA